MMSRSTSHFDYVLIGGGLQNALIALGLGLWRSDASVALVERAELLGGNHLWSFHADDLSPPALGFVRPLVVKEWAGYQVRFPQLERRLEGRYSSVSSARLHEVASAAFAERSHWRLILSNEVVRAEAQEVELSNGEILEGSLVVDARGPKGFYGESLAYQKFVGQEFELSRDTPITEPILMDAQVQQLDGFRFVYVLPFGRRRVLIEDTYFSDRSTLDVEASRGRIAEYAQDQGLAIHQVVREETGVLPLPARMPRPPSNDGPLRAGYGGGWFHPTTGYSFPLATRLAEHIASHRIDSVRGPAFAALLREHRRQWRFATFLNRLLFGAFPPEARWNVLERFYRLPAPTIRRFYSLSMTTTDRARTLCGKPPRGLSLYYALGRGLS